MSSSLSAPSILDGGHLPLSAPRVRTTVDTSPGTRANLSEAAAIELDAYEEMSGHEIGGQVFGCWSLRLEG
jgi:hypothetical protein